jgi:hypothetical protein
MSLYQANGIVRETSLDQGAGVLDDPWVLCVERYPQPVRAGAG